MKRQPQERGADMIDISNLLNVSILPHGARYPLLLVFLALLFGIFFTIGSEKKQVFVLMSLCKDYMDLYIYGIKGAAEKTGFVCRRSDEIEHNGDIMSEIERQIDEASVIIAEMTDKNPNVFYEVGLAHARGKETILIAREGSDIPFDLRGKNHIFYSSIHDLERKLARRLGSL